MPNRIEPDEPVFVAEVPTIKIEDGLVRVTSYGRVYFMLPSTARAWGEDLRRKMDAWDAALRGPVPLK